MKLLSLFLVIGFAGSFGAMLRYGVTVACTRWFGTGFPIGTLIVNLSGSMFLGWFVTIIRDRMIVSDFLKIAIAVGFVGAYTTFSTFALDSDILLKEGQFLKALVNIGGSVILGIFAIRAGIWLATAP